VCSSKLHVSSACPEKRKKEKPVEKLDDGGLDLNDLIDGSHDQRTREEEQNRDSKKQKKGRIVNF